MILAKFLQKKKNFTIFYGLNYLDKFTCQDNSEEKKSLFNKWYWDNRYPQENN